MVGAVTNGRMEVDRLMIPVQKMIPVHVHVHVRTWLSATGHWAGAALAAMLLALVTVGTAFAQDADEVYDFDVGDLWLPLLLVAVVVAAVIAFLIIRRRQRAR